MARAATTSDVFSAIAENRVADREVVISRTISAPRELVFIVAPERIALLHGEFSGDPSALESVLTFAVEGAASRIEMRTVFPTKELRDVAVEKYHAIESWHKEPHALSSISGASVLPVLVVAPLASLF